MYVHGICHVCTWYIPDQSMYILDLILTQQVFVANTEVQYVVISLSPPLQGRIRTGAVPVLKMVIYLMQGQTLLKHSATMYLHLMYICCVMYMHCTDMYIVCTYMHREWSHFACRVGDGTVPLAIVLYIDGSFVKHKIPVRLIYVTVCNLNSVVSGKARAWNESKGMNPYTVHNMYIHCIYMYVHIHTCTYFVYTCYICCS
jgi:hypothetical protein